MMSHKLLLDGGMGHHLRRLGVEIKGAMGSQERFLGVALANVDSPALVERAHREFLEAGATVITTNTYSCVPASIALSESEEKRTQEERQQFLAGCISSAGRCAANAVADFTASTTATGKGSSSKPLVAGCLPPLGPSYRYDLVPANDVMDTDYAFIMQHIAPFSDVLLCETMSCVREGYQAASATKASGLPVWVSWTLSDTVDGCLRSGESIEEAVSALAGLPNLQAMMVNCCSDDAVTVAMPRLAAALRAVGREDVRLGGYANGFRLAAKDKQMQDAYRDDLTPEVYRRCVEKWMEDGATIVGGCCGVFPEHIQELALALEEQQR